MPFTEDVLDGLHRLLEHYWRTHPEADSVTAADLAVWAGAVVGERGLRRFVATVGVACGHLACAICAVWESEVWQARETWTADAEET